MDVACGTGAMFEALRERKPSHITAVDLSEKMIEIAARKVEGTPCLNCSAGICSR